MSKPSFAITILLCFAQLCMTAQEISIKDIEGIPVTDQINLHDLLYANKAAIGPSKVRKFADASDNAVSYEDRITNMPQYIHDFIAEFGRATQEVLDGGSNWLSDPTLGKVSSDVFYYPLREVTASVPFTFPSGSSQDVIKQAALNAIIGYIDAEYDILKSFLPYALICVNLDYPEAFWVGTSYHYGRSYGYRISYYPSGSGTVTYTLTLMFYLHVNGSYDLRNGGLAGYNFQDTEQLANGVQFFHTCVQNIMSQCPADGSRYDKLLATHDWLTHNNCYNPYFPNYSQQQIGDTPWSALSALEGNIGQKAPVCEGYSRAFKVLCKEMGIPCILMSGNARSSAGNVGGSHMWNYVQMENGKWYAIDVTWDDPTVSGTARAVSGYETLKWFMLGSNSDLGNGFLFIDSHPEQWETSYSNDGSYSWELKPGPELSLTAYNPEDEDGIKDLKDSKGLESWFTLDGRKIEKPQKGINIIRMSDGSTRKVLIK